MDYLREIVSMKNHIGFTGTQDFGKVSDRRVDRLWEYLKLLKENGSTHFHHGDCIGADNMAATQAHRIGFKVIVHPPKNASKRAFNAYYVEEKEPKGYIARNHDIVDCSEILIGMPKNPKVEELRSGTWATIRYARKIGKSVGII